MVGMATMEIAFKEIETEFKETFGYVRQDIAEFLKNDRPLHYTIALLVCCTCEMLTWHRDLRDDQAYEVFSSLLPDPYTVVGKTLWEALRNGLAHKFRPDTIRIEDDNWRFTISSQPGPLMRVTRGQPHWIHLNIRDFSSRVISLIDAYEQELRTSPGARLRFHEKSKTYIRTIPAEAARIADALRSVLGKTHS
jgi:hypothetical protein